MSTSLIQDQVLPLQDLFNSAEVLSCLETLVTVRGHWAAIGGQPGECDSVTHSTVDCTATSMEFFDRLYDCRKRWPSYLA
jgi:hypothetical protein